MGEASSRDPLFQTAAERAASRSPSGRRAPRVLIVGAGQRGVAYSNGITAGFSNAIIAAVAEPVASRRDPFGKRFIWPDRTGPREDQAFDGWADFIRYETARRELEASGERTFPGVDAVFVCTLDRTHREIVDALAPLQLHVMCEKPLAATLTDCVDIYTSLGGGDGGAEPSTLFSIGHVLRYSAHHMLLRKLLVDERIIGDVLSVEHTEPVGWWHFSHSYVRGNWRREDAAGPSLMTKCCHDVDLLLWLLCYRSDKGQGAKTIPPSWVSSTGNLAYFTRRHKPAAAGAATNCLSCAHEPDCRYSAKRIYLDGRYGRNEAGWPMDVLVRDIEDIERTHGVEHGRKLLTDVVRQDYDRATAPDEAIRERAWYGRCVWESDNDVMDEQVVTMQWDEEEEEEDSDGDAPPPKLAILHMAANTEAQCERRGKISGTLGEIQYDSFTIRVFDFATGQTQTFEPKRAPGGHGGGDYGLAGQFTAAVDAVINGDMSVPEAQTRFIGCTLEDAFMSHAMVFAAEQARKERRSLDWKKWWAELLAEKK